MKILYSLVLCALPLLTWAKDPIIGGEDPVVAGNVEKKKTIIKLFDVDASDALTVDNQFGQVTVALWDKKEIRVQITISANSDSEERAQRFMDAVDIDEKRTGNQIVIRTNFSQSSTSNWNVGNWKNGKERNNVRIDYAVSMPRQNALTVRNRFGNTNIPAFYAPLTVHNRYGNFNADDLANRVNDIDVAYGQATIRTLDQGKLDIAYGGLDLDRVNVLTLVNKFGKLRIGEVGRLNADIDYSGATIGTLRESGRIKLSFSGGFRIEQMPKTADNLDIQASYSSVAIPMDNNADSDFDVTVSSGNFNYLSGPAFHLTTNPDDKTENSRGPRLTKQYVGKIGRGTGTKVRVVSKFGNVSFR